MLTQRRHFLVLLALLPVFAPAASAGPTTTSYDVTVLPDPTQDVLPGGECGAPRSVVGGPDVGHHAREVRVPRSSTLSASVLPVADAFAGNVGLNWTLRIYDRSMRELARSSGPPWDTKVSRRFAAPQRVWLLACNRRGHPQATVTYTLS